MCKNNNGVPAKINIEQCMLDLWVNYKKKGTCILTRPLVALAINSHTQYIEWVYCAIGDKAIATLQNIINEINKGKYPEFTDLVTNIDFDDCGDEVLENIFELTTSSPKGKIEQYWRNLSILLDIDNSHGQVVDAEAFLNKLINVLEEVKRNGS